MPQMLIIHEKVSHLTTVLEKILHLITVLEKKLHPTTVLEKSSHLTTALKKDYAPYYSKVLSIATFYIHTILILFIYLSYISYIEKELMFLLNKYSRLVSYSLDQ